MFWIWKETFVRQLFSALLPTFLTGFSARKAQDANSTDFGQLSLVVGTATRRSPSILGPAVYCHFSGSVLILLWKHKNRTFQNALKSGWNASIWVSDPCLCQFGMGFCREPLGLILSSRPLLCLRPYPPMALLHGPRATHSDGWNVYLNCVTACCLPAWRDL